jgi:hypothetical protein
LGGSIGALIVATGLSRWKLAGLANSVLEMLGKFQSALHFHKPFEAAATTSVEESLAHC